MKEVSVPEWLFWHCRLALDVLRDMRKTGDVARQSLNSSESKSARRRARKWMREEDRLSADIRAARRRGKLRRVK